MNHNRAYSYSDDIVIRNKIEAIPEKPKTVTFLGGPWHGHRRPYDPSKKEFYIPELVGERDERNTYLSTETACNTTAYYRNVRYTLKPVKRIWTMKHKRSKLLGMKTVGVTSFGGKVQEEVRVMVEDEIVFADHGICMVADGWTGDPQVGEEDWYGREVIDRRELKEGVVDHDTQKVVELLEKIVGLLSKGKEEDRNQ